MNIRVMRNSIKHNFFAYLSQLIIYKHKICYNKKSIIKKYNHIFIHASYKINIGADLIPLENELYNEINTLGVGPMGVGGETTCLAVKVNYFPMHIASLPVAINIQCHSSRHTEVII